MFYSVQYHFSEFDLRDTRFGGSGVTIRGNRDKGWGWIASPASRDRKTMLIVERGGGVTSYATWIMTLRTYSIQSWALKGRATGNYFGKCCLKFDEGMFSSFMSDLAVNQQGFITCQRPKLFSLKNVWGRVFFLVCVWGEERKSKVKRGRNS